MLQTKQIDNIQFHQSWESSTIYNSEKKRWGFASFIGSNNFKFLKTNFFNKEFFNDMKIIIKNAEYEILEIICNDKNNVNYIIIRKINNY